MVKLLLNCVFSVVWRSWVGLWSVSVALPDHNHCVLFTLEH